MLLAASTALFLSVLSSQVAASPDEKPDILRHFRDALHEARSLQSSSCGYAYNEFHNKNSQFDDAFEDVAVAFAVCEGFCDVDGRAVLGDSRFDGLIQSCRDAGGTIYFETIDVDCTGSQFDHTITNTLDCLPPECSESDNQAWAQNTEEILENNFASLGLSCDVEYISSQHGGGSVSAGPTLTFQWFLTGCAAIAALAL